MALFSLPYRDGNVRAEPQPNKIVPTSYFSVKVININCIYLISIMLCNTKVRYFTYINICTTATYLALI